MTNHDERPILLTGGMIFDGSGQALFAGDVLVAGNRIDAVVPAGNEPWNPPPHAVRIDLGVAPSCPGWSMAMPTSPSPTLPISWSSC